MNAAARRNMTGRLLDVSRDGAETLRFYSDSTEWPKLRAGADARAIVPRVHTAAALEGSDTHELVIQQFAFLHGRPDLLLPLPPFSDESETWHHLPRLMLDDVTVSPERWTPEQELVDELGSLSGPERYLAWRRYARQAGITELLYIRSGQGGLPILFRSDSVLELLKEMCGLLEKPFDPIFAPPRAGDVVHSSADISAAKSDLGFVPSVDSQEGLRRTIRWYAEQKTRSAGSKLGGSP